MIDWSHSQQTDWEFCTRCWYINSHQSKLGIWVPTPYYFVFGTLLHDFMWKFPFPYRGEQNPESDIKLRQQWDKKFLEALTKLEREVQKVSGSSGSQELFGEAKNNLKQFERRRKTGLRMLTKHYKRASALQKPWKKEEKFAICLGEGGGVNYWVVLDRLYQGGEIEDVKTGRQDTVTSLIKQQMLGYRAAAQLEFDFPWRGKNTILYLPEHKYIEIKLLQKEWFNLRRKIVACAHNAETDLERLRKGEPLDEIFPLHPNEEVCKRCRFQFPCRVKGLMTQKTLFYLPDYYGEGRKTVAIEPVFLE